MNYCKFRSEHRAYNEKIAILERIQLYKSNSRLTRLFHAAAASAAAGNVVCYYYSRPKLTEAIINRPAAQKNYIIHPRQLVNQLRAASATESYIRADEREKKEAITLLIFNNWTNKLMNHYNKDGRSNFYIYLGDSAIHDFCISRFENIHSNNAGIALQSI